MKTSASDWQERYEALRQRERHVLLALLDVLGGSDAPREDTARLQDAVQHLSGLFCLAVIGEFNAGKSTLLNALLGARLLPEGITPTTSALHLVTYGSTSSSVARSDSLVEWTYPAPWLKDIYLVDTPGSNTVFQQHEARARSFLHRADMLFFVISARRALAESDRLYLDLIHDYGAKIVVILNQIDLLDGADEIAEVSRFVQERVQQLLGHSAPFFAVSAKWALQATESRDEAERQELESRSGLAAVWNYIEGATAERSRARQQLLTSLKVGSQLVAGQKPLVEARLAEWRQEGEFLASLRGQLDHFERRSAESLAVGQEHLSAVAWSVSDLAQKNLRQDYSVGRVLREIGRLALRIPFITPAPRESGDQALGHYLRSTAPSEIVEELHQTESALRQEGQSLLRGIVDRANGHLREVPAVRAKLVGEVRLTEPTALPMPSLQEEQREVEKALDASGLLAFVRRWSEAARGAWWRAILWELGVLLAAFAASYYVKTFVESAERTRFLLWIVGGAVLLGALGLLWLPLRRLWARRGLSRALEQMRGGLAELQKRRIEALARRYRQSAEIALAPLDRLVQSEQERVAQIQARLAEIEQETASIEAELARDSGHD